MVYQLPAPTLTLCGSTKFKEYFIEQNERFSRYGCAVFSVGLFGHQEKGFDWNSDLKKTLDRVHRQKIKMTDNIFVLNLENYIGLSTWDEIFYALGEGKNIYFWQPLPLNFSKDLINLAKLECGDSDDDRLFPDRFLPMIFQVTENGRLIGIEQNFVNLRSELQAFGIELYPNYNFSGKMYRHREKTDLC